jgi:glutamyl-tRNA(Gln) amidotransferase subunit E
MYPDTDSPPIPLEDRDIEKLRENLPSEVIERYHQLKKWGVAESTMKYIFKRNLFGIVKELNEKLDVDARFAGNFIGHRLKWIEGHCQKGTGFEYTIIIDLFRFMKERGIKFNLAGRMMAVLYQYPKMDMDSILTVIKFKSRDKKELTGQIGFLNGKFTSIAQCDKADNRLKWIMSSLFPMAQGNMDLTELYNIVKQQIEES